MSLLSESELTVRAISVCSKDLVLLRHHLEASEGVGILIAKKGGNALLVAPCSRASELDEFIDDMREEFGLVDGASSVHDEVRDVTL